MTKIELKILGSAYNRIKWHFCFGKNDEPFIMYSSGLKREVAEKILKMLKWKFVSKDGYATRFEAPISDEAMRTLIALEKTPLRQLKTARTKRTVKEITQAVAIGALLR